MNTAALIPAFLKELICKVFELLVLLLEFSRFEILLDELGEGQVDFQEKFPDYCQGGSMSPDSFLPSILLLVVIIVVVVGVMVVVVIIVAVVVVVESNPLMKASMSFSVFGTMFGHKTANSWNLLIPSDLVGLIYSNRLGVCIPPGQGVISQDSSGTGSLPSGRVGLNVSDEDPTYEDGDIGMGDSIGVLMSLGGGISLGGKKSQESNIGDSGNIGDGGKTGGGSIGACGGIGEMASEAKRYLDKLSEGSGEMFLSEAGK
ncbi:hypothetical protein Tco_0265165 [Tanacetum coccineum]